MLVIQGSFLKAHTPKVTIYDSNNDVTMGVLPWDSVSCETMTWDIKFMLDIESFNADIDKHTNVTQEVVFNDKNIHIRFRLNECKYINGLMDIWDGANSPSMPNVFRHGYFKRIHFQAAREV